MNIPEDLRRVKPGDVPLTFVPRTPKEMAWCLSDPIWRICSAQLYKIKVKPKDEDENGEMQARVVPFKPNRAQRKLMKKLH